MDTNVTETLKFLIYSDYDIFKNDDSEKVRLSPLSKDFQ